ADPKLFRQCSAMGGTSTAEEHERELTRVVTALNGHQADLVRHARIDHLVDARRSGRYAQTETVRESGDRRFSSSDVQPQRSVGEVLGVEVAEQHIRVGHRRLIAAPAVACRSGLGPGAHRPDPQTASRIEPRNAAATRTDRVAIHHWGPYREWPDTPFTCDQRSPTLYHAHVVAG